MIEIKDLSFAYRNGEKALNKVNLSIKKGEFVLLTGDSGSGKSTLIRCLNGLVPNFHAGELKGSVSVDGNEDLTKTVGMVFQDPESMFLSTTVEDEIGFAPSTLGYASLDKKRSVTKILKELSIEHLRKRNLHDLSGGEKQKVALASVLVVEPKVLVLDEPLSELDHESAARLMELLKQLNKKGMTIILIEQRTERVYEYVTREIVLDKGKVVYDGKPKKNGELTHGTLYETGETLIKAKDVSFSYEKPVLKSFSHEFKEGELVVLEGPNGSGKTTLLKLMMGLLKPKSGAINVGGIENPSVDETSGHIGYVFQNPDNHLFAETVKEEVEFILKNTKRMGNVDKMLKEFDVLQYKESYPRYLSGGEKQRVALASILVAHPKVLLLDEPTRGMDHKLKEKLAGYLTSYTEEGNLVIMATHDDYMASCATRRIKL